MIARTVIYPHRMPAPHSSSRHRRSWLVPAVAVAVAGVAIVALWRPWTTPETTVAAGDGTAIASATPELLDLPEEPTVLVFGDSWTYGSAATEPALGYAYVVADVAGWTTIVDGVRGSGYLKAGVDGPDYVTRIAALDATLDPDLIIVQGSINDRRLPLDDYRATVDAAWDALAQRYPRAQIVIFGPAPHVLPVEASTARIDDALATAAAARGWWYISPLKEGWITSADYTDIIDTGAGNNHPSTAGHRYLAERLAAAVAAITR